MPFGETVEITETSPGEVTISGKTGHWVKIKWKKVSGWAFDAFLAEADSPMLDHFEAIAIEVNAPEIKCDIYKKAGEDKMQGSGGAEEIEVYVTDKQPWISGNSVVFEYWKKINKEGETLTTEIKCKLVKTEFEKFDNE